MFSGYNARCVTGRLLTCAAGCFTKSIVTPYMGLTHHVAHACVHTAVPRQPATCTLGCTGWVSVCVSAGERRMLGLL